LKNREKCRFFVKNVYFCSGIPRFEGKGTQKSRKNVRKNDKKNKNGIL